MKHTRRATRYDYRSRGAAFVETVALLAAFTLTMVSVLTIYSLTWKQAACVKIFNHESNPNDPVSGYFNPYGRVATWRSSPGQESCWVMDRMKKLF